MFVGGTPGLPLLGGQPAPGRFRGAGTAPRRPVVSAALHWDRCPPPHPPGNWPAPRVEHCSWPDPWVCLDLLRRPASSLHGRLQLLGVTGHEALLRNTELGGRLCAGLPCDPPSPHPPGALRPPTHGQGTRPKEWCSYPRTLTSPGAVLPGLILAPERQDLSERGTQWRRTSARGCVAHAPVTIASGSWPEEGMGAAG